jgi:CubicO group peptidase (beta-lactamase class C family)
VLLAVAASAAATGFVEPDATDRFVEQQMRRSQLPAVSVVLVNRDQGVYAAAYGPDSAPITADSPFLIGSLTKTFSALAIAQLVDAGKLQFDDPIHEHLPDFTLKATDAARWMTLRHLLTHTSGLSQWSGHDRRAQRTGTFAHIAPARSPGTRFEYSSINYIILGKVIEQVSGLSFGDYLQRHIFEPLEMRASFTDLASARAHGLVGSYWYLFGLPIPGREIQQPGPLIPAGFVASSARDLGNYLAMLLNDGRFQGREIVSPETLREMFTPWGDLPTGPGMAWGIGRTVIGHAGSTPTFSARLAILPQEGYAIAVLTNVNSGPFFSGTRGMMDGLIRIVRGEPADLLRPDEILLKLAILFLVLVGVVRMLVRFRQWSRRGYPRRLLASRPVVTTLGTELVAVVLVLFALPRWLGVPLLTILEYFPDLGIAIFAGVSTGLSSAAMRSFILSADTPEGPATRLREAKA